MKLSSVFQKLNRPLILRMLFWILVILAPLAFFWIAVAQPTWSSSARSSVKISPERLREHVRFMAEECYPRTFSDPENLEKTVQYVAKHFIEAGAKVRIQEYDVDGTTYKNVIGSFGPSQEDLIVIGAHYDSCNITPGADDNASGVSGLIELAYRMGESDLKDANIELVAYCLEEPPFFGSDDMGSYRHAKQLHENGVKVRGALILEMIGYFTDEPRSQDYPIPLLSLFYPWRGNFLVVAGKLDQRSFTYEVKVAMHGTTDMPVYSINAPRSVPGIDFSDHRNYWRFDYDAVMITDTSFYRNKHYHQMGDNTDLLDYERMSEVVVATYACVEKMVRK